MAWGLGVEDFPVDGVWFPVEDMFVEDVGYCSLRW
jgi:hypothetical protein